MEYEPACLTAVLAAIRAADCTPALTYKNSGVEPGGHPPPRAGDIYVSIEEEGVINEAPPNQDHLKERLRIAVYVSVRSGRLAPDRTGDIYLQTTVAFGPVERPIIAALHGQWSLLTAANALLEAGVQPMQETLWYTGRDATRIEPSIWSGEAADPARVTGWVVRKLNFVGFRRVTANSSIS